MAMTGNVSVLGASVVKDKKMDLESSLQAADFLLS